MNKGLEPIYPILDLNQDLSGLWGLTKREYFAGLAMQGILANEHITKIMELPKHDPVFDTAEIARKLADELLKQLEDGK